MSAFSSSLWVFSKKNTQRILNFLLFVIVALAWTYVISAGRHASIRYLKNNILSYAGPLVFLSPAMEVLNENAALLSNLEVLMLLRDLQAGRNNQQKPNKDQQHLGTIAYETIKYLERTPCALQTPQHVASYMEAMKDYRLTKAEKLQLLNNRPTSEVELILMVEESEERLSDEDISGLVKAITTHLPGPEPEFAAPVAGEEEENESMEEGEEAEEEVDEDYVAI